MAISLPSTGRWSRRWTPPQFLERGAVDVANEDSAQGICPGQVEGDNQCMSTALWIIVALFAVGTITGGLLRMRVWLQRPVPPEVIEAAHRDDVEDD
ncbi:hypothetical protein AWC02_12955 [Mycolicibacter engbaekii]|uniref:Uncharacterized protein n=1 Tax=Mycolicibacter engbaekii TaxID=188915 RepID=A0A1X1TLN4_9MYCO|nr:hypothetical protein AWC02_12955 [Mycolicibacter engbaekii]